MRIILLILFFKYIFKHNRLQHIVRNIFTQNFFSCKHFKNARNTLRIVSGLKSSVNSPIIICFITPSRETRVNREEISHHDKNVIPPA